MRKWFLLDPMGKCTFGRKATNRCKQFQFWYFWERPLYEINEYAFKHRYADSLFFSICRFTVLLFFSIFSDSQRTVNMQNHKEQWICRSHKEQWICRFTKKSEYADSQRTVNNYADSQKQWICRFTKNSESAYRCLTIRPQKTHKYWFIKPFWILP